MCGIALIRFRKPFPYYVEKYNTSSYGLRKLYLLMQKQHNRGQDGAGLATLKIDVPPGKRYISRIRTTDERPIEYLFETANNRIEQALKGVSKAQAQDPLWIKENLPYMGEVLLGHLRYGTHGGNSIENCHPFLRQSNWRSKNLIVAGNFNLTNVDELFEVLLELGQHPKDKVDTVLVMEKIGHFLDEENERIYAQYKGQYSKREMTPILEREIDLFRVLERACRDFDGGYAMAGITGYGASFVARDPHGIRPAYFYANEEVIVAASEKPAIKAAFNVEYDDIQEIPRGHALVIDKEGNYKLDTFIAQQPPQRCSFERIYFSRGSDPAIYQERKHLGRLLCPQILKSIDYDLANTVFSYIPNTAETAFLGVLQGMEHYLIDERKKILLEKDSLSAERLGELLSFRPRVEKLVIKDAKLRTFITDDEHRDDLVANVYDTTYEVIQKGVDNIVLIDDSIVRGTTLEKSILRLVDRLQPKKIIIVSSAPQIRFPDCYGIDMSRMGSFIAFRAVMALLNETGREGLIEEVYQRCLASLDDPSGADHNYVQALYEPFTDLEISAKIAQIIHTPKINASVDVIYQTVDNLLQACPNHQGDWYFTGNYPTKGGNRVVNRAFVNYMAGKLDRAY
ncbi:amidophosphoribosyltransferase [Eisenibacter elegans]|uniref:amidophosphoribosyltransferase n=1 Tax=Eisenibacter elegans TaxID=997 RepID=UPI000404545F|nr:amidophosphoribosyltransferase [Eisenibacter elegans]